MVGTRARTGLLGLARAVIAVAHTFPLRRHLGLFAEAPSLGEAWKGFGPLVAIALCFVPVRWYARGVALLRARPWGAFLATTLLILAHLVPAFDHLPAFARGPSWGDGWRGFGSALAAVWFAAPLSFQGRVVGALRRGSLRPLLGWVCNAMLRRLPARGEARRALP